MNLDRYDRKLLFRLRLEGPQFLHGNAEHRAFRLHEIGLTKREWCIYSSSPTRRDYAWKYRLSEAGVAELMARTAAPQPKENE